MTADAAAPARARRAGAAAARRVVDAAALVGVVCALAAVVGLLAGWRPVVLVSGSMAPAAPAGSLVLTRPVPAAEVRPGDVVTVPVPGADVLVTHRVTAVREVDGTHLATLRGDANPADDPTAYPLPDPTARAVLHVPGVGRLVSGTAGRVLTVGAAALVVLALLPTRAARPGRRTAPPQRMPTGGPPARLLPPTNEEVSVSEGNGVHTVHRDGAWVNEVGGRQVGGTFEHKDAAVSAGREEAVARSTEHHIHGLDGRVHEKNSYGNDPRSIPG